MPHGLFGFLISVLISVLIANWKQPVSIGHNPHNNKCII